MGGRLIGCTKSSVPWPVPKKVLRAWAYRTRVPTIFSFIRMSETNYGQHGNEGAVRHSVHPYWKRAHHDWRFWVGLVLMLAAITIYVLSDDLALLPRR